MIINFFKYQGTGNDFVIIDARKLKYDFSNTDVAKLCNRKFGIGSDGLIIIKDHKDVDFEMQFYNPDGSQSFCGNGSRCAVLFSFRLGICPRQCTFLSNDGIHTAAKLAHVACTTVPRALRSDMLGCREQRRDGL